jgi:hypothetical protein
MSRTAGEEIVRALVPGAPGDVGWGAPQPRSARSDPTRGIPGADHADGDVVCGALQRQAV